MRHGVVLCGRGDGRPTIYVNLVEQWNGTAWSIVSAPDANTAFGDVMITVDCFGPASCVAGGYDNTIDNSDATYVSEVLTWDGSTWAVVAVPEPAAARAAGPGQWSVVRRGSFCVGAGYATYGSNDRVADAGPVGPDRPSRL